MTIDRVRLQSLIERERAAYEAAHPLSMAAAKGGGSMIGGVPMTWMGMWSGGFPLQLATAHGNRLTDLDGHSYVDFCLGDTGAMAGHSPAATVAAIHRRVDELGGITTMLPTEDAAWVADELARRFGLPQWSFSLTATDANRWAIRIARHVTGRPKILVHNHCYHGSVDETVAELGPSGEVIARPGNVGAPVALAETTRVVEINDLEALERELAFGDVAVVLIEPALTNIGIVLPDPGYHSAVRALTRRYGTLLAIDETPHLQRRPRRLHPGVGPRAGHRHGRQVDRRWHPRRRVRAERGAGRADPRLVRRRPGRRRRGRRDAGRQRAVDRGDAGDPG